MAQQRDGVQAAELQKALSKRTDCSANASRFGDWTGAP